MKPSIPSHSKPSKTLKSSLLWTRDISQNSDNSVLHPHSVKSFPSSTMMSSALKTGLKELLRGLKLVESSEYQDQLQFQNLIFTIETFLDGNSSNSSTIDSLLEILENSLESSQIVALFRQQVITKFIRIMKEDVITSKRVICQSGKKKQSKSVGSTQYTRRPQNGAK